jgi:Zn-dependent metalloprotease
MRTKNFLSKRNTFFYGLEGLIIVFILLIGNGIHASAQGPLPQELLGIAEQCLAGSTEVGYSERTGLLSFVGTMDGDAIQKPRGLYSSDSPEQAARGYLSMCGPLFGLKDVGAELQVARQKQVEDGRSVLLFQQMYQDLPVFAGELKVQLNAQNDLIMVNGGILPGIELNTSPSVKAADARQAALQAVIKEYQLTKAGEAASYTLTLSEPELLIYNPTMIGFEGATALAWRVVIRQNAPFPIRQLVMVDAQNGEILLSLDQLDRARNRMTYDMNNGTNYGAATLRCSESDPNCTAGDAHEKAAHIYAGDTYNFYKTYHGRDSLDNAGMALKSYVHYSTNYCNAFWNGSVMTYGDGCIIVVDDVVAHEMTHGVTEHESNLVYANQSGAINESFSDIWGEFVDLTNGKGTDTAAVRWLMGEDTSIGAIRNMKNPPQFSDPDRMGSPLYYKGTADNGGVHTNSGVGNKAAYLITDGATFNGYTVTGIGITKTAKIFYEVQTNILTSGATYADLGRALSKACNTLIGKSGITADNCEQVRKATYATEMVKSDPSPVSPTGTITDTTPTYKWTKLAGATQYNFDLYNSAGTTRIYTKTVPSSACGTTTCSNTPTNVLPYAAYKWKVRAYVSGQWKSFSAWEAFTVVKASAGFNSQFNGSATGWQAHKGTWQIYNSMYYGSAGVYQKFSSASYNGTYANFDYSAKVKRIDPDGSSNNSLIVRGTPTFGTNDIWNNCYMFSYSASGYFSVWSVVNGTASSVKGWTTSPHIIKGNAWNILRVKGVGNTFTFYINGNLVWTGPISGLSTGRAGLLFFNYASGTHQLQADYATLNVLGVNVDDTGATAEVVDPVQEAFNQEADLDVNKESQIEYAPITY